jgi:hypothetical protein
MRPGLPSVIAISLLCCAASACEDADKSVAPSPTAFTNQLDLVGVAPSPLGRDGILAHCPGVSPFPVPFVLNVTAGTRPLTLAEVRIQPTNPFGRTSPPTIFDSSSLTRQFGSLTVASFGVRQFPFTHPFTCDMRGTSLIVSVTMRDGTGMNRVSSSQVPVY